VVKAMALWAIDDDIRGHSAQLRASIRAERSCRIVTELFAMVDQKLPRVSGKSKLTEIRYILSRRTSFERFLADGCIEIDSNIVERAIRPANHHPQECTLRWLLWWWLHLSNNCHVLDHRQDEQRRSSRLAAPLRRTAGGYQTPKSPTSCPRLPAYDVLRFRGRQLSGITFVATDGSFYVRAQQQRHEKRQR
jgi:hypothetical protein